MDIRNTKQKKLIYEVLTKERCHPTIQELYLQVSKLDPSIGQATVYRNINRLVEEKKVIRFVFANGVIRYDATTFHHYHFLCNQCGRIYDFYDDDYLNLQTRMEKEYHIKISSSMITFSGICSDCFKKE